MCIPVNVFVAILSHDGAIAYTDEIIPVYQRRNVSLWLVMVVDYSQLPL